MALNNAFQYQELEEKEFRLLVVHPKQTSSTVSCELSHASLDSPPDYVAISYAWGDATNTELISIGGVDVPVTTSLCGALKALRNDSGQNVTLWADAICINQQNNKERSQQVKEMARIYKTATSVAVWLGPAEENSTLGIRFLRDVARCSDQPEALEYILGPASCTAIAAVVSLFTRSYWKRLWVVQEVLNAARVDVYCGSEKLPWELYQAASKVFQQHQGDLSRCFPGLNHEEQLPYADVLAWSGPSDFPELTNHIPNCDLHRVLRDCRGKLAADPRDKVFGLLGILPQNVSAVLPPNYSLPTTKVYTSVVTYLLRETRRFDIICEAIHIQDYPRTTHLPTWVPDWSQIPAISSLGPSYKFDAAPETEVQFSFPEPGKLKVSAIYLGKVKDRGIPVPTLCKLDDFLMAFLHWRAWLEATLPGITPEAFCRTLCMNQTNGLPNWATLCCQSFSASLRKRLPHLELDTRLAQHADANVDFESQSRVLEDICGKRMRGRCMYTTSNGLIGMGPAHISPGDIVVVPLGCYTPVILRPGRRGEYTFEGDAYVDGYMLGLAVEEWNSNRRQLKEYVLS